jgi:Na+/proline symporter
MPSSEFPRIVASEILTFFAGIVGAIVGTLMRRDYHPAAVIASVLAGPFMALLAAETIRHFMPWLSDVAADLAGGLFAGVFGVALLELTWWRVRRRIGSPEGQDR